MSCVSHNKLDLGTIISILIGFLALVVAVIAIFVASKNHKRNEKFLMYSYWLQQRAQDSNKLIKDNMTQAELDSVLQTIEKVRILNDMFSKEFPDPSEGVEHDTYFKDK